MTIDLHRLALAAIDLAADELELDAWLRALLHQPERTITVQVPYQGDDGEIHVVRGYRVAHSTARGPAKGGTRFHPAVTPEEVMGLATLMSVKTALMDLPLGGGKAVLRVPEGPYDREKLFRAFGREVARVAITA